MNHSDHVNLLKPAELPFGGIWADFGAGSGAFTLALRELVGPHADIYAVDKDRRSLEQLEKVHREQFGTSQSLHTVRADFTGTISLPPLDGIVMANSLHYVKNKEKALRHVRSWLKLNGALLLVEYNVDSGISGFRILCHLKHIAHLLRARDSVNRNYWRSIPHAS